MPHHRSSAYLSPKTPDSHPELFRTAELNVVGWAAVAGLCATGAAIGLATARLTGASSWITVPTGSAAALAAVIAADRHKWAGMTTTYSWTDDPVEVRQVADLLTRAGINASVETGEFDGVSATADRREPPRLRYRNRDHRHVARAFRRVGLPPPPKR